MRRAVLGLVSFSLAAGLAATSSSLAVATPDVGAEPPAKADRVTSSHDLPNPLSDKQRALRQEAIASVLNGSRKIERINGSDVVKVGTKKAGYTAAERAAIRAGRTVKSRIVNSYVQLSREQTDKIFVVLAEFGDERDPRFPDKDTNPTIAGPARFDGPRHNEIPAPNRAVDNSTVWQADYSADYFRQLYFGSGKGVESVKTYYEKQSSGRYSVDGTVTDWVTVKYNAAAYGRSDDDPKDAGGDDPNVCASNVCNTTWDLVRDGLNTWVDQQKAAGRTSAQIKAQLATFDVQDRYDYDGDGNFNESDGYLDHFQVVHSGGDQADGDPYQGEDAIWSHRWYAYGGDDGKTGPANNLKGGTQVGDTGIWAGDYTIQPENGGLSVFAHEYGHDLGLPDHYDTNGGENSVNWWTLMAQSRARGKNDVGIGTRPADLGAWDKLQLGWLDYSRVVAGQRKLLRLGPHEYNSRSPQAVAVVLPDKTVTTQLPAPAAGSKQWWSGSGDNRNASLTRTVAVPSGSASLSFRARYDIETGYDYALVEVDDGSGFQALATSASSSTVVPEGIDGTSAGYVPVTADLSAYAGKSVALRFRYVTDGGVAGNDDEVGNNGLFLDEITLGSFTDGAEAGDNGWTATGFSAVGSSVTNAYDHFYLASYRSYLSYDRYLKFGPYNFGFTPELPDKVEFFPYAEGLLVTYWDTSQTDNNTSSHPGEGLVLPVDAHPETRIGPGGTPWRGRIQAYDAPFSTQKAGSFTLHRGGVGQYIQARPAQPLFDDRRDYFVEATPTWNVKVPNAGVTMRVLLQTNTNLLLSVGSTTSRSTADVLTSARAGG